MENEPSYPLLRSLEVFDHKVFSRKADIFYQRTINPVSRPSYVETSEDALKLSMNYKGCEEKRFPCDGTSRDLRSGSPLSGKDQHHAACLWIDSRSDKQCSNQSTSSGIRTGAGTG